MGDNSASAFCKILGSYCDGLERNCNTLKDSISRKPIPLGSSASFVSNLESRLSQIGSDLEALDSMVLDSVSFEELLGYCNEVYKDNHTRMTKIEEMMLESGYNLEVENEGDVDDLGAESPSSDRSGESGVVYSSGSHKEIPRDDFLLDDSTCWQKIGLSDATLAALASVDGTDESPSEHPKEQVICTSRELDQDVMDSHACIQQIKLQKSDNGVSVRDSDLDSAIIKVSKSDYDQLPSYLRTVASWQDLEEAVVQMNDLLLKKTSGHADYTLDQEDLSSLRLGTKAKSYLLLLIKMKILAAESNGDGVIVYRVSNS